MRWSNITFLLLPCVSLTFSVGAVQIPFLKLNDNDQISLSSDITIDNLAEDIDAGIKERIEVKEDKWECDVRSWVRAPDLRPSSVIPAETRLSANGSDCKDIEKWEVGLRFKERAIVKLKSKSLDANDFPKKPTFPKFNDTSYPQYDFNDIYFVGGNLGKDPWDEYNTQMKEYNLAIKNESLWDVDGSERIVFDITKELPYTLKDTKNINEIHSFTVQVPNTNFPPVEKHGGGFMSGGNGDHLLNTETLMEYYHLIHLSNGTTLDIPAGRTGFIPRIKSSSEKDRDGHFSTDIDLDTNRIQTGEEQDDLAWMFGRGRYGPNAPDCDESNMANFHIQVGSNMTEVIQGQNITLNFTLTRTGNGSEYPAYLQVGAGTQRNVTWAYKFINSDDEYHTLLGFDGVKNRQRFGPPIKMLQLPSRRELENMRDSKLRMSMSYSISDGRFPLGYGQSRYDIEMNDEVGKDVYQFQMEVTIPDDHFPSFDSTFESYRSMLEFRLTTIFLCEPLDPYTAKSEDTQSEDDDWTEYELPSRENKKKLRVGTHLTHTGSIPIHLALTTRHTTADEAAPAPTHYLDPDALGPVILLPSQQNSQEHSRLGVMKEESKDQLRKNRYSSARYDRYRPGNIGGGFLHAARLWQKKESKDT
ncbi:hypothetical protein L486_03570 [Kwoniella mangroviensis CBS 10435]|uniref:Uncharacterized protein n=1 Tax=Kwoniella mangroviensis CBS 10435 TaxID=1331196 RepID=A0A1B9IU57_9TREE|nr:hypothetical protein L486_03570 [Kwoniella mangroviensis CBS 10435]